jgi:CubicO group peptidase (beta-lactamase class C family)
MPKRLTFYACLIALAINPQLTAQKPGLESPPPVSKFREINDSVVVRFNRGDYKAIYQATDDYYKGLNSEGELVGGLEWNKKTVGNIVSSELIEDLGKVEHFKWTGEKGVMKFELWLEGPTIRRYKFNTLIRQPGWPARSIRSDNRLKTAMDSVVDKYATIYMSDPKAVGLSLGLYKGGKQYSYHYGEVEKDTGKIPDDRTIFSLGSISKTFIGVLLARAVTEHKLSLQDDIRKFLPGDFPNLQYKGHPVRLVDLARHTSGINKFRFNNVPANYETMTPDEALKYFSSYTEEDLLRDLRNLTVDAIPGASYHYSLGGINLLGMALSKVYQTTLDQLVRGYYGRTFHMTDTKLISDPEDMPRYAKGYDEKGQLMPQMPEVTVSLYTVKSTTKDILNYVEANVLETNSAIRLSHQQTWGDPKSFAVGLTWDMEDYYGRGLEFWHSGFDYGSISLCTAYPSLRFGMFLWANDDSRQGNLYDMERNIKENLEYLENAGSAKSQIGGSFSRAVAPRI